MKIITNKGRHSIPAKRNPCITSEILSFKDLFNKG